MRRYAAVAGVHERLAHPHALRCYYATTLSGERVAIQDIKARLGHASIETTARYLASSPATVKVSPGSLIATTRRSSVIGAFNFLRRDALHRPATPREDCMRATRRARLSGNNKNDLNMLTPKVTQLSATTAHPIKPKRT